METDQTNTKESEENPRQAKEKEHITVCSDDSSPLLEVSARDQEKYQQWYDTEAAEERFSFEHFFHSFSHITQAGLFSRVVLAVVTVIAVILGIVAIHLLPESGSSLYPTGTRMNSYKRVPEEMIDFTPQRAFAIDFENATAFALDAKDRVYIGGDTKIDIHSPQGKTLFTLNLDQTPSCVHVPSSGQKFENALLVGFPSGFAAYRPNEEGFFETEPFFQHNLPGVKPYLKKLLSSSEGLFLADAGEKLVYKINESGKILLCIGKRSFEIPEQLFDETVNSTAATVYGEEFPGFSVPNLPFLDLAISPRDGLLYVTNPGKHSIEVFSQNGDWFPKLSWGTPSAYYEGFSGCCNPSFLLAFPDGRFATSEKFIPRLKVFDRTGKLLSFIAIPENLENPPEAVLDADTGKTLEKHFLAVENHEHPPQIAVNSQGTVLALDPLYAAVRFYTENE